MDQRTDQKKRLTPGRNQSQTEPREIREAEKKLRIFLCVLPAVLILLLLGKMISDGRSPASRTLLMPQGTSQEAGIVIRQKNSGQGSSLLETKQKIELETIKDGLKEMGFLITEEYYFTELLTNKKLQSFLGIQVAEESYMVSYEGYITAGIDFTEIDVSLNEEEKALTIFLPGAVIKDTVIDPDSMQVHSEKKSIFLDFTEEERNEAMKQFKADVLAKASEKGILEKADRNAELVIRNFVRSLLPAEYAIRITS